MFASCIRRVRARRSSKAQRIRERKRNEPRSLPRRRRSISNPPPLDRGWFSQSRNQEPVQPQEKTQSPLLLLPAEIREAIFVEVVGRKLIHLVQLPKRLGHLCCYPGSSAEDGKWHRTRQCIAPKRRKTYWAGEALVEESDARSDDGGLGLLRSCRQIYRESIGLLYSTNTFDVNHPQTLLFFARTIRPYRLAAIQSLQISFPGSGLRLGYGSIDSIKDVPDDLQTWLDMCNIITTKMTGLKSLSLGLERQHPFIWTPYLDEVPREDVEKLLQYLYMLRGLDHFDMWVSPASWSVDELLEELRGLYLDKKPIEEVNPSPPVSAADFLSSLKMFLQ
jgi:hypothetical protein